MSLRNRMKKSTDTVPVSVQKLKTAIRNADAVVIGAGAGLSTSAGFVYSGERFQKYFFDFAAKYRFSDMYSGGFYPYVAQEEFWAYWSRYIWVNRYMDVQKGVYSDLYDLVKDKDYFVITTNVDHCFQKAGFDKARLFYKISIWQGDITRLAVDAIVNAANSQMLGCFRPMHTCIDNCIHTFAGVQLRAACAEKMDVLRQKYGQDYEQPTAVPMLTDAYNLPAKSVVHVVGPIVYGALTQDLEQNLADCYRNVLDLCREHDLKSVAFCCISTGVFRFPNERAAEIAVDTVTQWLQDHPGSVERVIFNVFKETDKACYEKLLRSPA